LNVVSVIFFYREWTTTLSIRNSITIQKDGDSRKLIVAIAITSSPNAPPYHRGHCAGPQGGHECSAPVAGHKVLTNAEVGLYGFEDLNMRESIKGG
jgi:hypothetical protein